MPSVERFEVMDVSVAIVRDPKFKRLRRLHPGLVAPGFMAYVSTLAESWANAGRVDARDAWPELLEYDEAVVDALRDVRLLDADYLVPQATWDGWFVPVLERRSANRARWREAQRSRRGVREDSARSHQPSVPIRSVPIRSDPGSKKTTTGEDEATTVAGARARGGPERVGRVLGRLGQDDES